MESKCEFIQVGEVGLDQVVFIITFMLVRYVYYNDTLSRTSPIIEFHILHGLCWWPLAHVVGCAWIPVSSNLLFNIICHRSPKPVRFDEKMRIPKK